jgi:hypothetical protein
MPYSHRIAVSVAFAGAIAATVVGARSSLSAATAAVANIVSATCHDSVACIHLVNASTGVVVSAEALKNNAIVGTTDLSQTGLGDVTHYVGGVVGVNKTLVPGGKDTAAAVVGVSAGDALGVLGISQNHNGTSGQTFNDGTKTGNYAFGVFGYDRALDTSGSNDGVYGVTTYGIGTEGEGIGLNSAGVVGGTSSASASAPTTYSGVGVSGYDFSSDGGLGNIGVSAYSNGTALFAMSNAPLQPAGKSPRSTILDICSGAPAFIARDASGTKLMSLDCKGNLTIAGHLTQPDSVSTTPAADGTSALVNVERGTRATIEETGSAALINGVSFVPLSAGFANVTDRRAAYAVLLTPGGESRGLYVTKAANGFTVRENGGGRSSVPFDYRVVGIALREKSTAGANSDAARSSLEVKELRATVERLRSRQAAAVHS